MYNSRVPTNQLPSLVEYSRFLCNGVNVIPTFLVSNWMTVGIDINPNHKTESEWTTNITFLYDWDHKFLRTIMFVRVESQPFILPTPGTPRINWRIVAPIRNYQMNRVADISTNQIKKKNTFWWEIYSPL